MTQWRGNKRQALSLRKEKCFGYLDECQRMHEIVMTPPAILNNLYLYILKKNHASFTT